MFPTPSPSARKGFSVDVDCANGRVFKVLDSGERLESYTSRRGYYRYFRLSGVFVKVSRFIYSHAHGPIPPWLVVDHINRVPTDDRLENLRLITVKQNNENRYGAQCNSKTGLKGVCSASNTHKFRAQIKHNGKKIHLGLFESADEAHVAYCRAAAALHSCNPHSVFTE